MLPHLRVLHPLSLPHPRATLCPRGPCPLRVYAHLSTLRQQGRRAGRGLNSSRPGAGRCPGRGSTTMEASLRRRGNPCIRRRRSMDHRNTWGWRVEGAASMGEAGATRDAASCVRDVGQERSHGCTSAECKQYFLKVDGPLARELGWHFWVCYKGVGLC